MLYSDKASTVIFVPGYAYDSEGRDTLALETVLTHRMYKFMSRFKKHGVVGVKSCENEPAFAARYARAFVKLLVNNGQSAFLCNTSNRHLDSESNAVVCAQHAVDAYGSLDEIVPFVALDGLYGEHEISRKSYRRLEAEVFLAGELPNLDGLLSVCCVTSSHERYSGGAIVNLGQGLASKRGKITQRTTSCPQVNMEKCYKCRRCVRLCPTNAISISEGHALIDPRKCIKCGKCVETAHYGGISYDWNVTPEYYNDAVIRHAKGVLAVLEGNVVCINIILREDGNRHVFAGGMVSQDPVALDSATIDFCETNQLLPENQVLQFRLQLEAAESAGLGTGAYGMETVAY